MVLMRFTVLLMAVFVGAGCASYQSARTGGVVLTGVGLATASVAGVACLPYAFPPPQDEDPNRDANLRGCRNVALVGAAIAVVGIALLIDGTNGMAAERRERNDANARRAAERATELDEQSNRLQAAVIDASAAARAGHCDVAVAQGRSVWELNPYFYANVFAREPSIMRCLPAPRDRFKDHEAAFALYKDAARAARDGNCTAARDAEPRIRYLDASVHTAWFAADPDIKACLASAPAVLDAP